MIHSKMEFQYQSFKHQEYIQYEISLLVQSLFLQELLKILCILDLFGVMCILDVRE